MGGAFAIVAHFNHRPCSISDQFRNALLKYLVGERQPSGEVIEPAITKNYDDRLQYSKLSYLSCHAD